MLLAEVLEVMLEERVVDVLARAKNFRVAIGQNKREQDDDRHRCRRDEKIQNRRSRARAVSGRTIAVIVIAVAPKRANGEMLVR